jgi:hypothetical protein
MLHQACCILVWVVRCLALAFILANGPLRAFSPQCVSLSGCLRGVCCCRFRDLVIHLAFTPCCMDGLQRALQALHSRVASRLAAFVMARNQKGA